MKNVEKNSNPFCFIHIEKAAGTTLHHWLGNNFIRYQTFRPGKYSLTEKEPYLTRRELRVIKMFCPYLKGFGGHSTRHFAGYETLFRREVNYFTFLREPISRYLSHYTYQKYVMGIDWTIEKFIKSNKFDNFMTRRISKSGLAIDAINELKSKFKFVGLTEKFDESILMLSKLLFNNATKASYEKRNESTKRTILEFNDLPFNIQNKILENNKEDIILYDFVCKNIYLEQKEKYGNSLEIDLKNMKKNNEKFKYSFIREMFFILRNKYGNNVAERIARYYH